MILSLFLMLGPLSCLGGEYQRFPRTASLPLRGTHCQHNLSSISRGGAAYSKNNNNNINLNRRPVNLDLSGRLKFLLMSAEDEIDQNGRLSKPIFQVDTENDIKDTAESEGEERSGLSSMLRSISRPSIKVGLDYDFSQRWFGANRLFSNFCWKRTSNNNMMPSYAESENKATQLATNKLSKLHPHEIQFTAEKGIFALGDQAAAEVGCSWKISRQQEDISTWQPLSLSLRLDSSNTFALSTTLPLHRRIQWTTRLFGQCRKGINAMRFPLPPVTQDSTWLIPEVFVNTMGDLKTVNQAWLPWRSRRNGLAPCDDDGRLGLRLSIRRRCAFDFISPIRDETFTWLGLEVLGMANDIRARALLEAALEDPFSSTHLSLYSDFVLPEVD